jgi:hypothetical protein
MLGSVGASGFSCGGAQLVSNGGPGVLAAGVSFSGGDGVGVMGRGSKQPAVPITKLISNKATDIRFIDISLQ